MSFGVVVSEWWCWFVLLCDGFLAADLKGCVWLTVGIGFPFLLIATAGFCPGLLASACDVLPFFKFLVFWLR